MLSMIAGTQKRFGFYPVIHKITNYHLMLPFCLPIFQVVIFYGFALPYEGFLASINKNLQCRRAGQIPGPKEDRWRKIYTQYSGLESRWTKEWDERTCFPLSQCPYHGLVIIMLFISLGLMHHQQNINNSQIGLF